MEVEFKRGVHSKVFVQGTMVHNPQTGYVILVTANASLDARNFEGVCLLGEKHDQLGQFSTTWNSAAFESLEPGASVKITQQ